MSTQKEYKIDSLEYPNIGIINNVDILGKPKMVQVKNTIPGQKVRIRIRGMKRRKPKSTLIEITEKASIQTEVGCGLDGVCGGCTYQTISSEDEQQLKKVAIQNLFKDLYDNEIPYNLGRKTSYYRNKMEYSFGDLEKSGPLTIGLHCRGRFYEITPTENCNIAPKDFEEIRRASQEYFRTKDYKFYHSTLHTGTLRFLVLKKSFSNNEIMVNLVTTAHEINIEEYKDFLLSLKLDGKITSIYHTINDQKSDAVNCDELHLIYGNKYITEKLCGLDFRIGPFSFFQPNPVSAEEIFERVLELLEEDNLKILDLYSGTGTIGQILSKNAKKVIGIEIVEEAVNFARENAEINGIRNIEFIVGDVLEELEKINGADVITIDPPRPGIHPHAIDKIIDFQAEKIIYISCNPKSMRNDLEEFTKKGYNIELLEIYDQFHRTSHCEALALLRKQK